MSESKMRRCTCALPQEISDMIFDFLHDDRRTLKSCALVCKPWVHAAHQHLFYDYRIEATPSFRNGYAMQLHSRAQQSSFYLYIQELTLAAKPSRSSLYPELNEDDVAAFFALLPRLRLLRLEQTGFTRRTPSTQPHAQLAVDTLSINWMYPSIPGSSSSTHDLLSLFREIRELDIRVVHRKHLPDAAHIERDTPSTITVNTLTLSDVSGPLLGMLQKMVLGTHLHTIKVAVAATTDVIELGSLLATVGTNVVDFQLSIWNFWANDFTDWNVLGLTRCPNLQSVVLLYANSGPLYSWETVYGLLAAVPATVTKLTIVVRDEYCLNSANWLRLHQGLEHVTSLQHLHFRLCRGGDLFQSCDIPQKSMDRLRRAFPSLSNRWLKR
ncbi:hypothetical protein BDW22DRAFT_1416736 [Trametopsis cervina]|nr:hypothetical protein BDW22DRAFT_1416736 [Trametopsis cervina]